jgi:hypothetical protein
VATVITSATHGDSLSGSPEKRLDIAPDGTLWAAIIDTGRLRFFSSSNGGNTWSISAGSDLSLGDGQDTAVPSFFIDADGYAHVSFVQWERDPQNVIYGRGTPRTGGGWSWTTKTIGPAGGRVGVDSDIIAFRNGSGWVVWVAWTYDSGASGARVSKLSVSASGTITIDATAHGPASGYENYQVKSIEFAHTGDGKTPSAAPHIYFFVSSAVGGNTYIHKATYSSGNWTWGTPITIETSVTVPNTVFCSVYDGTRDFMVWTINGTSLKGAEWDGSAGSTTARNPPAMPGGTGTLLGISLAVDPSTADVYLVAYGATIGNLTYVKFTRATTTWGSWTTAVTRSAYSDDGDVQLVRHPPRDSIDMIWSEGGSGSYTIKSQQLLALTRSPSTPTLVYPANGARVDLASGATFSWQYNAVSPGDTQQAWAFRRQYGGGPTTEYWNVSTQAWQGTEVYNTTDTAAPYQVSFPSGKWTTGTTYSWSVRTKSSTGANSSYASNRTVTASLAPTVVVTSPSGISYGSSTPLVTWTYTSTTPQRDYEVRIVPTLGVTIDPNDPLPATWTSGVVTSSIGRSVRVGTSLTDGVSYRAYVRSTDTTGVASAWVYSDFTPSLQPPAGPLAEVSDEVDWDTGVARVHLALQARSNYFATNQAIGQAGWENDANANLFAQVDDPANQLLAGLKMVSIASGDMRARTTVGTAPIAPLGQPALTSPLSFPVVAGNVYTSIASFKTASGGTVRAARIRLRWYDDDDGTGVLISETIGDQIVTGTTSYVQAFTTDDAPDGAVLCRVALEVLGTTAAAETFYASRLSFHPGRDTAWQSGGYSQTQTIHVERSDDGGVTFFELSDSVKPDFYQQATIDDRSMPFNTDIYYRAVTNADVGGSAVLTSDYSPLALANVAADLWAIRDLNEDSAEFNAYVIGYTESDEDGSTVFRPAGRYAAVVDTEELQSPSGTIRIYVPAADVNAIKDVVTRTATLVVQSPAGRVSYMRFTKRNYEVEARINRTIDINFVEVT